MNEFPDTPQMIILRVGSKIATAILLGGAVAAVFRGLILCAVIFGLLGVLAFVLLMIPIQQVKNFNGWFWWVVDASGKVSPARSGWYRLASLDSVIAVNRKMAEEILLPQMKLFPKYPATGISPSHRYAARFKISLAAVNERSVICYVQWLRTLMSLRPKLISAAVAHDMFEARTQLAQNKHKFAGLFGDQGVLDIQLGYYESEVMTGHYEDDVHHEDGPKFVVVDPIM